MPSSVRLVVIEGDLVGEQFEFAQRTVCVMGRATGCWPRIKDPELRRVSRHHCLLDINPPDICIRDFGSRNGTWVNGGKIGQRRKGETPAEAARRRYREVDLTDGDEFRLGRTVFRVEIVGPTKCAICAADMHDISVADEVPYCQVCRARASKTHESSTFPSMSVTAPSPDAIRCTHCQRDVSGEPGASQAGDYLCEACRTNPLTLASTLLHQANTADHDAGLVAIEGYEIVRELGRGGMGAVYLARHQRTNDEVALKVMLPRVASTRQHVEWFLREIDVIKPLCHPNVVRLFDSGHSRGTFFFTLEYCDLGSIADVMRSRHGTLPVDSAVPLILQVLRGLEHAHSVEVPEVRLNDGSIGSGRGLVHRDLKPHNIFLVRKCGELTAKVGDYGLAKAFDLAGLSGQTCTGSVCGTPHFMPRQQVLQFRYAKPAVDVWAAAATLYYMLTGLPPRSFPRNKDPWQVVLQSPAVPIRERRNDVPKRLAGAIDEALIDQPDIRFDTAQALRAELQHAMGISNT